jgi:transcriptional regulator GlxA family with amidase domain
MNGAPRERPVAAMILAYPGVNELDLFGAYAVLAKAAGRTEVATAHPGDTRGVEVRIAGDAAEVTGSGGARIGVQAGLDALVTADAVVVPGGGGAAAAAGDSRLTSALREAYGSGARLYGVCSGTLVLAAAGVTRGRTVAVHHAKRDLLAGAPAGEVTSGLVTHGRITTVGGDVSTSVKSVDLAFQLLADFAPHLVDAVGDRLEVRPGRTHRVVASTERVA